MNLLSFLGVIAIIVLLAIGIYYLWLWIMRKRSAKVVDSMSIQDNIRKVQVIDVRETAEFNVKHILGARNIPMSQFQMRFQEIRKDTPVYLYDESYHYASRCADILRKKGYTEVFILKGGFSNWFGKVKSEL